MISIIRSLAGIVVMILLVTSIGFAFTVEQKKADSTEAPKTFKNQTVCLITGEKIDTSSHIDIQGQRIYMCCDGCASKIKADPDKYFKKAADQGILFENVQEKCPISGDKINKEVYRDYQGRRIYFCCKGCITEFEKDPAAALVKMDKPVQKDMKDNAKGEMEQMHHGGKK
jgi:YHS domain-containing protein